MQCIGAGGGGRTHDLLITNQLRYHCATPAYYLVRLPNGEGRRLTVVSDVTAEPPNKPKGQHQPSPRVIGVILVTFILASLFSLHAVSAISIDGKVHAGHTSTSLAEGETTTTLSRAQVRVQVANGTKTPGLARTVTQRLMTQGWDMMPGINGPRVSRTVIYYRAGFVGEAMSIHQYLNVGSIQQMGASSPVSGAIDDDVVVLVGPDLAH